MLGRIKHGFFKRKSEVKPDSGEDLRRAIISDDVESFERLLAEYGDHPDVINAQAFRTINGNYYFGPTPLILAARHGRTSMAERLLALPELVLNAVDEFPSAHSMPSDVSHQTALLAALIARKNEVARILIENPACNMNAMTFSRMTVLMVAAEFDPDVLPLILEREGVEVDAVDERGRTALHYACLRRNPLSENIPQYITSLLENPAVSLDIADVEGMTALMYAASRKDVTLVVALIEAGADLTCVNGKHQTAADIALLQGCDALASLLQPARAVGVFRH